MITQRILLDQARMYVTLARLVNSQHYLIQAKKCIELFKKNNEGTLTIFILKAA